MTRFRNLAFAFDAVKKGGNMPCILNAANEVVVEAFLKDRIGFLQMSEVIEQTMCKASFVRHLHMMIMYDLMRKTPDCSILINK
jgi:1-deoxy-D-xylulose 5-phosphate reductoisomerase (EC 1.1.1.267)